MVAAQQERVLTRQVQDAAPVQRTTSGGRVGAYGSYWLDGGDTVLATGQTSLIVDPPDGLAPPGHVRGFDARTGAVTLTRGGLILTIIRPVPCRPHR